MKRRFLTILTVSFLVLGFAGTSSAAAKTEVINLQSELPGTAY
ncbi:hypothetical protein [Rossellomorea vietnamensis]|nr:hypothetical protein [Rossellomorea vietnamensis]